MKQELSVQEVIERLPLLPSLLEKGSERAFWGKQWDGFINRITSANAAISPVASRETPFCKEGCCHCCHHLFAVSVAEVQAIGYYLLKRPDLMGRFLALFAERLKRMDEASGLVSRFASGGEEADKASKEYYAKRFPCAFLDQGRCLIYPVRPVTCACFISIVPPRVCAFEPKGVMTGQLAQMHSETSAWLSAQKVWGSADPCQEDLGTCVFRFLQRLCCEVLGEE